MISNGECSERQRTRTMLSRLATTTGAAHDRLRDDLVVRHLNVVWHLAKKFADRGESLEDLIQVGTIGLMKAIDRFDAGRGAEFITYAVPTIVGEIKRHFRDRGWAMRVPRRLQELGAAVIQCIDSLTIELQRSPTVGEVAVRLHASEDEVLEAREVRNAHRLLSLDSTAPSVDGERARTRTQAIGITDDALDATEDRADIERALHVLTERERTIVYLRFYESASQRNIADGLHLSQMQVSRLQAKALEKLRTALLASAAVPA